MHKVYENNDVMMYLKKRYCCCCGGSLNRKRTERVVKKNDPDHGIYCTIGTRYTPHGDIMVIGKEYYCKHCNKSFSCEKQGEIIEAQNYYKRKVVSLEEIEEVRNQKAINSIKKIKKMQWLLLIPIIGAIICMIYIFNGRLSEKTASKDGIKLLLGSVFIFIAGAFVLKLIVKIFSTINALANFLNNYQNIIILIIASLLFNFPIFKYIKNKFM